MSSEGNLDGPSIFTGGSTENPISKASLREPNEDLSEDLILAGKSVTDVLGFINYLSAQDVEIVPLADLADTPSTSSRTKFRRSGAFKEITHGFWTSRNAPVALKVNKYPIARRTGNISVDREQIRAYNIFMQDIIMEVKVMTHKPLCDHPNMTRLLGISFEDLESSTSGCNPDIIDVMRPILILEPSCPDYPDLRCYICFHQQTDEPLGWGPATSLACDIANGLVALHSYGVLHADLKPSNVLIYREGGKVVAKLCDFGLSGISSSRDDPRGGDHAWLPPEALASGSVRSQAGEVYTYGLVFTSLILGTEDLWQSGRPSANELKRDTGDKALLYLEEELRICSRQRKSTFLESTATPTAPEGSIEARLNKVLTVLGLTVRHDPNRRLKSLAAITKFLNE